MPTLLVIDDEPVILHAFERAFANQGITLLTAETAAQGEELFKSGKPDAVVLDLKLPDKSGLECFKVLKEIDARVPVIFITGHGTVETAIEATKLGAYDYLFKPLELDELQDLVNRAFHLSHMARVHPALPGTKGAGTAEAGTTEEPESDAIIGRCPAMKDVYTAVGRVADQDITVLILGESGTGKELIAQAVYHHSSRANKPFQTINCAAIPESLLESELFGHERGAFTGAERQRIGKFEQANHGTLFLDEVGDMSPITQAKFLRVLQNQSFERVGGNHSIQVDVRVIAATNQNLKQLVADGLFRADLYFRLSVVTIELPPLRERGKDIELLTEFFIKKYSNKLGKSIEKISPEAIEKLADYNWLGNVRELESVIKQSLLKSRGSILLPEFIPNLVTEDADSKLVFSGNIGLSEYVTEQIQTGTNDLYSDVISKAEKELILLVLTHTHGNQLQAAKILGISRVTLRSKIRSLNINMNQFT